MPAGDVEGLVEERLRCFLLSGSEVLAALEPGAGATRDPEDSDTSSDLVAHAAALAQAWPALPPSERRRILLALIQRVDLMPQSLEIRFLPERLASVLGGAPRPNASPLLTSHAVQNGRPEEPAEQIERTIAWSIPARLQRSGIEKRLLIEGVDAHARRKPDHSLARLLAQAQQFQAMLLRGGDRTMEQLARDAHRLLLHPDPEAEFPRPRDHQGDSA